MKKLILKITLESDALPASGEGYGDIIDNDAVYDDNGIPFIPAKRIKGLLRDSLKELKDTAAGINSSHIDGIFGIKGSDKPAPVYFSNLYPLNYASIKEWAEYYVKEKYISPEEIRSQYTNIRTQTKLNEKGTAEEHSLRTIRVLDKGLVFEGEISAECREIEVKLLSLAAANLKMLGTKRNRGYGRIKAEIYDNKMSLFEKYFKSEEDLCIS